MSPEQIDILEDHPPLPPPDAIRRGLTVQEWLDATTGTHEEPLRRPRELPLSKHARVRLEVLRSICATVSALGTLVILCRVFGLV